MTHFKHTLKTAALAMLVLVSATGDSARRPNRKTNRPHVAAKVSL